MLSSSRRVDLKFRLIHIKTKDVSFSQEAFRESKPFLHPNQISGNRLFDILGNYDNHASKENLHLLPKIVITSPCLACGSSMGVRFLKYKFLIF